MPLTLNGTTGEVFPSWTTGTRPSSPVAGQTGYNSSLATLEAWNGSAWGPVVTTAQSAVVTQAMLSTNVAGNGPAFSATITSAFTPTSGSFTRIPYNNEVFDTNSNYDNSTNYRFTPTVAGYYQINAAWGSSNTNNGNIILGIYKNGSIYRKAWNGNVNAGSGYFSAVNISALVGCNGSTDYIEIWVNMGSAAASDTSGNYYFDGAMVRTL